MSIRWMVQWWMVNGYTILNFPMIGRALVIGWIWWSSFQVNVAQGIYLLGSKLNHSCITNVHASFKNRRVRVRTILPVQAGSPLELCYGAQVSLPFKSVLWILLRFTNASISAVSIFYSSRLFMRYITFFSAGWRDEAWWKNCMASRALLLHMCLSFVHNDCRTWYPVGRFPVLQNGLWWSGARARFLRATWRTCCQKLY